MRTASRTGRLARSRFAFTAMEVLMSIGLMALTAGITIPMLRQSQADTDLDIATEHIVQALRAAQTLSQAGKLDASWGVYVSEATVFAGDDFATHNPDNDVVFPLPPTIDTSGLDEVVFSRIDGFPNEPGVITVLSSVSNRYREITIDPNGVITVSTVLTISSNTTGGGGTTSGTTGGTTSGTTGGTTSGTTGGDTSGTTGGTTSGTTGGTTSGTTGGDTSGTTGGTTSGTTGGTTSGTTGGDTSGTTGGTTSGTTGGTTSGTTGGTTSGTTGGTTSGTTGGEGSTGGSGGDGFSCATRYSLDSSNNVVSVGTSDINVKVLGSEITYGANGPDIPVRVSASLNGGIDWSDLYSGNAITGGEQHVFSNIPHNTSIALRFNGRYSWLFNKTYRSDVKDGHVIILRNGDSVPSYPAFANQQNLTTYIRTLIGSNGKISIGAKDLLFLVELSSLDSSADFQDAVILVSFAEKPLTCNEGTTKARFKIHFNRMENSGSGDGAERIFVGPNALAFAEDQWIPLVDANGTAIIDGGIKEEVKGLAVQRGPSWVRILSHGTLANGKEIVDAHVEFNHAYITSTTNDVNDNKSENPTDGVISDTADGDEFVAGPNAKHAYFHTRVTGADDAVYYNWAAGEPSNASSSSSSSANSSSSSSSAAVDACAVGYTVDADGRVTLAEKADITLRIEGSESTYGHRGPKVAVRGRISFDNGATWRDLLQAKSFRGGEVSIFRNVPANSKILVEFGGRYSWVFNKVAKSGSRDSHVRVLKKGDDAPDSRPIRERSGRSFLSNMIDDDDKMKIDHREVAYLVELGEVNDDSDFQDAVVKMSIDKPGSCSTAVSSSASSVSSSSSSSSSAAVDGDSDRDGVPNSKDYCPATSFPEGSPTEYMSFDRYALTSPRGNLSTLPVFRVGPRKTISRYTIADTRGCSCEQLLDAVDDRGVHGFRKRSATWRQMRNLFGFYTSNSRRFGCGEALLRMVSDDRREQNEHGGGEGHDDHDD